MGGVDALLLRVLRATALGGSSFLSMEWSESHALARLQSILCFQARNTPPLEEPLTHTQTTPPRSPSLPSPPPVARTLRSCCARLPSTCRTADEAYARCASALARVLVRADAGADASCKS